MLRNALAFALVVSSSSFAAAPASVAKAKAEYATWEKGMKKKYPKLKLSIDWANVAKAESLGSFKGQLLSPLEDALKELGEDEVGRRALATLTHVHLTGLQPGFQQEGRALENGKLVLAGSPAMTQSYYPQEAVRTFLENHLVEPSVNGVPGLTLHQRRARLELEQQFTAWQKSVATVAPGVSFSIEWANLQTRENVAQIARAKWLLSQVLEPMREALTDVSKDDLGKEVLAQALSRVHFTCQQGGDLELKDKTLTAVGSPNMTEGYWPASDLVKQLGTLLQTNEPTLSTVLGLADRRALRSMKAEFAEWERATKTKAPNVSFVARWENLPKVRNWPYLASSRHLTRLVLAPAAAALSTTSGSHPQVFATVKQVEFTLGEGELGFRDGTLTCPDSPHPEAGHWSESDLVKAMTKPR